MDFTLYNIITPSLNLRGFDCPVLYMQSTKSYRQLEHWLLHNRWIHQGAIQINMTYIALPSLSCHIYALSLHVSAIHA